MKHGVVEKRKLTTVDRKKPENAVVKAVLEAAAKLPEPSTSPKCVRTDNFHNEAKEQLKLTHETAEKLAIRLLAVEEELEENHGIIEELQEEQENEAELEKMLEVMKIEMAELKLKNQNLKDKNAELRLSL